MTSPPAYALGAALPDEVAVAAPSRLTQYQRYPVYSWPWCWRRSVLIGPLALALALLEGLSHGTTVGGFREGLWVTVHHMAANLVILMAGGLLASAARYRRFPLRLERVLVVAAILLGMLLADFAHEWADDYHDALMLKWHPHADTDPTPMHVSQVATNLIVAFSTYFIFGGGLALRSYFSEAQRWSAYRERTQMEALRRQKEEGDMRLTLLQAQVEPHFLFNTLASVRSLIKTDRERAATTIDALVDHLRATIPKIRSDATLGPSTLAEQVDVCSSYLELMQVRMGERLTAQIDVPAPLRALAFPPLMLISLVENAVKHGAEPKTGPTCIAIRASLREQGGAQVLQVVVEDDGAGLKPGMGDGTGLANIRAQLRTRFGDRAALALEARPDGGVRAVITLPRQEAA